jgi:iron(III) transport system substrate-binding protein
MRRFTGIFAAAALLVSGAHVSADEQADLIEASKAETGLLIYSNLEPEYWTAALEKFNAQYPWIKVETTNMGGDLWEKYYAESSTSTRTADLVLTAGVDRWLEFAEKGEIIDYVSPEAGSLPDWSKPLPGLYTASVDPIIIAYNKFVVSEDKWPKSVADIAALAPDYNGKVSTYDAAANPFGLSLFWTWGQNHPESWSQMEVIGAASRPERSAGTIRDKVISGEYALGMFLSGVNIPRLSAPEMSSIVGWAFPSDGTMLSMRGLALTKAASSPASAKLMMNFLLSRDGQIALAQNGLTPYRDDISNDDVPYYSLTAIREQVGEDNILIIKYDPELMANREAFSQKWSGAFFAKK